MTRFLWYVVGVLLALVIAFLTTWAALALWYRLPASDGIRVCSAILSGLLGCIVIVSLFTPSRRRGIVAFVLAFGAVSLWWSTIQPPTDGNWPPEFSRQVTGKVDGDILTLTNVRDIVWRTRTDFTEYWETRSYDLSKLDSIDVFLSYWAGPNMAHFILSFGFEGDEYLAWSVEVRREVGGEFSPVADAFKAHSLIIFAADERDAVGLRTNIEKADVQIFRLRASPEVARELLLQYVEDANKLAVRPEFYNSITTNCTTTVLRMMEAVGDPFPFDWRLIVNGYLPGYAYDRGAVDTSIPLEDLRELGSISESAQAEGLTESYSTAIRHGVPSPK